MKIQIIPANGKIDTCKINYLDNTEQTGTWDEFAHTLINNKIKPASKNKLPAFIPASIKPLCDDNIFLKRSDGYEYSVPRRCGDNIDLYYALVLDFDGELAISEFTNKYEYLLYTTSNHTDTQHRFRVILPLYEPVPHKEIASRRNNLAKLFNLTKDLSTFACSRLFYLPTQDSEIIHNKGEHLDLSDVEKDPQPKERDYYIHNYRNPERTQRYIDDLVKNKGGKLHHNHLVKVTGALMSEGIDTDNILAITTVLKSPDSNFNVQQCMRTVRPSYYSAGTLHHMAYSDEII